MTTSHASSNPAVGRSHLIEAAGCVLWRTGTNGLEVLLVHRPQYDDWSWPKGKLEPGELFPVAAVREVAEETGLSVHLGVPLPSARYRLGENTDKQVRYWAAAGDHRPLPPLPHPHEVDASKWVGAEEAFALLSRRGDRQQLDAVVAAHEAHQLDTFPLIVLRHGHARPRNLWAREDSERPLIDAGREQALSLVSLLGAFGPTKVVSSPWRRCLETVRPFVDATGTKLRTKSRLHEDGHRRDRQGTARLVGRQLDKGNPVVLCTHRPNLGTVLGVLAGHTTAGLSAQIPRRDPFLGLGELLVAHVARASGRIVAIEQHRANELSIALSSPVAAG